jgi:hypothetical protein
MRVKIYCIESRRIGTEQWYTLCTVPLPGEIEPVLEAFESEKQAIAFAAEYCPPGWEARIVEHLVEHTVTTLH